MLIIGVLHQTNERKRMAPGVSIVTPDDLCIQVCNREVTFTARTSPPGHESEITWEVTPGQFQTKATGGGPVFTTSWTETGVKQVIARHKDKADDLILFVFRTPSGGATLGDILESAPPPVSRRPGDYHWYRPRQVPSDGQGS